jgi:hypothetical protein
LEGQIFKVLGAIKPKGLNRIVKIIIANKLCKYDLGPLN